MTKPYTEPAKGSNPALELWAGAGLREVLLPSGTEAKVRLIPVEQLVKRGLIPDDLTNIALQFATSGVETAKLDAEGMSTFLRMVDEVVAQMVREIRVGDEWVPVTLTPAMFEEFDFPGDDLEQLGLIAIRRKTPELVTLESMRGRGQKISDGQKREAEQADGSSVPFQDARSEPEVPDDSGDGGTVRVAPLGTPRDIRSGGRARSRRSGSRSAS